MKSGDISYRIEKSKKGPDTVIVTAGGRDTPIHSRVDPERDADLFRDRFDPTRFDLQVVLGTGLGYHLTPIRDRIDEYHRIILVDILPGLAERIRNNPSTAFLAESSRVIILAGCPADEVELALAGACDMDRIRGVSVLEHPSSVRAFGDYYGEIKKAVERTISKKAGDRATRDAFGGIFLGNAIRNLATLSASAPVSNLFGRFGGYPAVIVSSGPSLDDHVGRLRTVQDRLIIVAVDSALPVLSRNGIIPDIIISIDPQPRVQEHFVGCGTGGALIVHPLSCHPSVARRGGFLSLDSHPVAQLAAEVYGDSVGSVDSATGSVAGDAAGLCLACGFSAAAMTGLDFSFPGHRIYARGTAYQNRYALHLQDRLATVEGFNCRYMFIASGGLRHEGRFSRRSLVRYRELLEDFIRRRGTSVFRSLPGPGLPLDGAPPLGLDDFVSLYCRGAIEKAGIRDDIRRSSQRLDPGPLLDVLCGGGELVERIIAASLGTHAGEKSIDRYRRLFRQVCGGGTL